jgi:hypothetical protein
LNEFICSREDCNHRVTIATEFAKAT